MSPEYTIREAMASDLLLSSVSRAAREACALDLRLSVLQSNLRAMAAYRRCGFELVPYAIMVQRFD